MTAAVAPLEYRVVGDSWFFIPRTDTDEDEHRVDRFNGKYFCTCRGFIRWQHCKHADRRQEVEGNDNDIHPALVERSMPATMARQNPAALAVRLQDMKENRRLTRSFFAEVMEEGTDYGVIPGTDKPTLFKPGAEGLCELYGYAPTYKTQETSDLNTGFLRVVVTCTLVQRGTGEIVAEGLGECNTREARYFYRWMPEWELKKYPELWAVKDGFKKEERSWKATAKRKAGSSIFYRIENDDLFTLWNTVTKMAKKRSHVDATLSATRSSGIFSQGQAALEDWIEGDFEDVTEKRASAASDDSAAGEVEPDQPAPPATFTQEEYNEFAARIENIKVTRGKELMAEALTAIRENFPYCKNERTGVKVLEILRSDYDGVMAILKGFESMPAEEPVLS